MHLRSSIGGLSLTLACTLPFLQTPLQAQTDQPISTASVTRAIALYEYTGPLDHPTAARLIPISLFLSNHLGQHLEDAGVYLAQPIPFALQPGTLYLLQRPNQTRALDDHSAPAVADTIGAFALQSADPTPVPNHALPAWFGYGRYLTPAETIAATTPPTTPGENPGAPEPALSLSKGPDSRTRVSTPAPKPTPRHQKHPQQQAYVSTPTTPLLDDPDRPILTANPNPTPESVPALTNPLPADIHEAGVPSGRSLPAGVEQAIAISDPTNHPPESFAYTFPTPAARNETLHSLEALTQPALTHYATFNHLTPAPDPDPNQTTTPTFANAPTPTLTHAELRAYTLTPTAAPTYILTAESPLTTNGPIYITLIASLDPNHQPHILLLNLTDATHLDRTPNLLPIDAVDPDATHRADLLFELRSQTTRRFALYDLTTNPPHQTLLTTPIP